MAKAVTGKKPKPKIQKTDKAQSERFKQTARELGADESLEGFEGKFSKMVPPKRAGQE
jgi:hypothetical protein